MTGRRPFASATRPPTSAPNAQPSKIADTAKPVPTLVVLNVRSIPSTAPFTTALSYPNRNPPSAAAPANRMISLPRCATGYRLPDDRERRLRRSLHGLRVLPLPHVQL